MCVLVHVKCTCIVWYVFLHSSGGIVAAIAVTIFTIVVVLVGITVTILIVCLQKRRRGKKYILGASQNGGTQGIFVNAGATTLEVSIITSVLQVCGFHSYMLTYILQNGAEKDMTNSKLNHSTSITTSDFSGDHIYEMTEMTRITEWHQEATNTSPPSIEQLSTIPSHRPVSSSLHGNHMRQQPRSFPHYENTHVLHRYNSVGDYEMMKPQLQKIINKRHTQPLPVETVDIYSEVERSVDELYIEMNPEEMLSLSSEGENFNRDTHTVSIPQIIVEGDQDEINDISIKMETEEDKIKLPGENSTIQTLDNAISQPIIGETSEKEQNSAYIKMEPEGVTVVCKPLTKDKDKQADGQIPKNQTLNTSNEQGNIYIDMEQESKVDLPLSEEKSGSSSDTTDQQVLPVSQQDELNQIYIEMEQNSTNPPTPELQNLAINDVLDQPVIPVNQEDTEDKIYIEMEPDDMPGTLSSKHQPPHINSDTPDDQVLSQGSEDIYMMIN